MVGGAFRDNVQTSNQGGDDLGGSGRDINPTVFFVAIDAQV